ncbi:MAG: YggS family pyridoxal phosphate-dependent enzyme [Bacteroidota bacterium]
MTLSEKLVQIKDALPPEVTLVAVSKTKPETDILEAYRTGHRIFGENKVQEMTQKWENLPKDIEWHMIGHVQRNKVKYMAPFVSLIHGVESLRLLKEIDKQAAKNGRCIDCLLQMHIAQEETKFGLDHSELEHLVDSEAFKTLQNVRVVGLMGMATFTENLEQIRKEFVHLRTQFEKLKARLPEIHILSMGMSGDYPIAIEEGSTMVRIGSSIFGARNYS